ncbi:hypothetical protein AX17_003533 [Amanita inopinata Kibby_2008]|nr:hypothetical protein AX17_003533 [Amanita inopinata Kibby_2008]
MLNVAETQPNDWKYVSEGGATIVFSYSGPPNPIFDGTVLRLRKCRINSAGDTSQANLNGEEPDDPIIEYQEKCMTRLIPPVHLPLLQAVSLEKEWAESMASLHDTSRRNERRIKDAIDNTRSKAVLATDLVGGDWIAVEIKPKWAFLPSPDHLSPTTRPVKTRTCRFCMHSRLRAAQGETVSLGYCPLDLFSGEEKRMKNAVSSLWDAWTTSNSAINNLKIFIRGKMIEPSEVNELLVDGNTVPKDSIKDVFISAVLRQLMGTPVLGIISRLQRRLDALDIEGLSKLWYNTVASNASTDSIPQIGMGIPTLSAEPTIDEWVQFVSSFLSSESNNVDASPSNIRHYLLAYLLSATFKDCSLIIRLDFLDSPPGNMVVRPERVMVIDLDPKSMSRLSKWEKMDREIAHGFMAFEPKECIDASFMA